MEVNEIMYNGKIETLNIVHDSRTVVHYNENLLILHYKEKTKENNNTLRDDITNAINVLHDYWEDSFDTYIKISLICHNDTKFNKIPFINTKISSCLTGIHKCTFAFLLFEMEDLVGFEITKTTNIFGLNLEVPGQRINLSKEEIHKITIDINATLENMCDDL